MTHSHSHSHHPRYLGRSAADAATGAQPLALIAMLWVAPAAIAATPDAATQVDVASLSLEELSHLQVQTVYAAAKHEQKVTDAPASTTVVTRDTIQKQGYRTLADVLNGVGGFYSTYNRSYQIVGVRGFSRPNDYGGRLLVTVDGHRLNEPLYDTQFGGTECPVDLDLIDRVEVIRGPGSVIYGNNAFFGVINIVTRRGHDVDGAEVAGSYGSFDTWTGRATYGQRLTNGVEFIVSGTLLDSDGHGRLHYPEFQEVNGGYADNMDATAARSLFLGVSYRDFSVDAGFVERTKTVPTGAFGALFNDPRFEAYDGKAFADLKFQRTLDNELELFARAYCDRYAWNGRTPYPYDYQEPPLPGLATMDYERDLAESYGLEVQAARVFWERHRLTIGGECRLDSPLQIHVWDDDPPNTWTDARDHQGLVGAYLQDEYTIRPDLVLHAGARYDDYSTSGSAISPRAGLVYTPWEPTTFKLLYGEAYRAPNMAEWGFEGPGFVTNPDLGPETIRTAELVYEQRLNDHWASSLSVFHSNVDGLIDEVRDPVTDLRSVANLEGAVSQGVEVGLVGQWTSGLRVNASYTFADATDTETDTWLSNSPRHLGKLQLTVPVYREKIFTSLELLTQSERLGTRGGLTPANGIVNLTLFSRELVRGLEASASLYNLFDTDYGDPASDAYRQEFIAQDGRAFRIKLAYRF